MSRRRAARNCMPPTTDIRKPRTKHETGTANGRLRKTAAPAPNNKRPLPAYLRKRPALSFGSLACSHPESVAVRVAKTKMGHGCDLSKSRAEPGLDNTTYSIAALASIAMPMTRNIRTRGEGE